MATCKSVPTYAGYLIRVCETTSLRRSSWSAFVPNAFPDPMFAKAETS